MPRDIPVGNGSLLITFDELYQMRDLYYPQVGRHNHTIGHVQHFGVWADGLFSWVSDDGWKRRIAYLPDTLVTEVTLEHAEMGLLVRCHDAVDFHEPVYFRRCVVKDLKGERRDVRLFMHMDLSINGSPVGDTANYDPRTSALVMYKDDSYFLVNAGDRSKRGIEHWAIGHKKIGGAEGTWRDAEDGVLGRNAISQGSVDATVGFRLAVEPFGESSVTTWIACGHSYEDVRARDQLVWDTGPERMLARTEAYWKLWAKKEPIDAAPLPHAVSDLMYRSMLVMRTQIDNGGAIIAANDSDIAQFGGDHYSYCWMRDGALVAWGLVRAGQSELSRAFFRFAAGCIQDEGYFLHKYTPAGMLASSWHPWTLEGKRVLPIQQDETALVVWALREHFQTFRDVEFIKPLYEPLVARPAQWMLTFRDHNGLPLPSWDLWEERRGIHTFTVASVIGALTAAAGFAEDFGELDRAATFREGAERMRGALKRHMWNAQEGRFARLAQPLADGSYRLDMTPDSANFALWAVGGFSPRDPMIEREMAGLREALWVKTKVGGCARYRHDYYHQVESEDIKTVPGNPWVICTLWHAQYLIERASTVRELQEAVPLLEWATERAASSGVLAEQYHPYTGEPISVSPLTWSHSTFASVALRYLERYREIMQGAG